MLEAGQEHNGLKGLLRDEEKKRDGNFSPREVSGKGAGTAATSRRTK